MHYLKPCLIILITGTLSAGEIQVSSDFSGGSGEVLEVDQAQRLIRLNPTMHKDRGWVCWWYVKLSGLTPGETITLDVGEAPWATPDRAAYSLDNKTWTHTQPGKRNAKRIVYEHKAEASECWFAWGPPFTVEDAQTLVDNVAKKIPYAKAFELCKTKGGRSVPALLIQEEGVDDAKRRGVWIQARQHAWESGSSWVCRGFTEWLISDDPQAEALRKQAVIAIVPIMDIDNVAIGAGGKNELPQDHNRDWTDEPHWSSVKAAQKRILEWDKMGTFDVFIDLHNPGANDKNPYFYIPPKELLTKEGQANLSRFLQVAKLEMTGPLSFKGDVRESGINYDKNWKKISKNWVYVNTKGHAVSVTLETAWNTPNSHTAGYQTVGSQLGKSIERFLRTADKP
jgi:hypothetical protein